MTGSGRPILALVGGRGLAFCATFVTPLVLVRVFDQQGFGTYKQFFLLWSTLYALGQFGMAESLFYFVPLAPRRAGAYVANALVCLGAAGLLGFGALRAGGGGIASWLGNAELARFTSLTGLFLALTLVASVLEIVMVARKKYARAAITYGLSDLAKAAFFVLPALALRRLDAVLLGAVAFAAARLVVTLVYLVREFGRDLRPSLPALGEQLVYVVPFGASVLGDVVQTNVHSYLVSHAFGAVAFAVYSVGCLNIPLVDLVTGPASNVMMVRMAEALREGRGEEVLGLWHDTTRKLAILLLPLVAFVLLTGRDLVVILFTEAYRASGTVFMIWSTGILWMALNTDGVLRVHAQTGFLFALSAFRLGLNVVLLVILLPWLGPAGAALATILAAALAKLVALDRVRHLLGGSWRRVLPWGSLLRIAGVAAGAGAPVVALLLLGSLGGLPFVAAATVLYGASLVGLARRADLLTEGERLGLQAWVQKAGAGVRQMATLPRA